MSIRNLIILLPLLLFSCSTPPSDPVVVPNLRIVSPANAIFRGGQPTTPQAWATLVTLGVSNVVKLNYESEGSDSEATQLGLKVYRFPMDLEHQILEKPDPLLVSNAVAAISPGSFVHCEHGQDRTGVVIACYRVWHDHWPKSQASLEMQTNGFHSFLLGLADFWEDDVN
jgi:tyrosine-protein phosphatase SIW14